MPKGWVILVDQAGGPVSPEDSLPLGTGSTIPSWRRCPGASGPGGLASNTRAGREATDGGALACGKGLLPSAGLAHPRPSHQEAAHVFQQGVDLLLCLRWALLAGCTQPCALRDLPRCALSPTQECVGDTREHRGSPQGLGTSRVTLSCPQSRMHLCPRDCCPDAREQEAGTQPLLHPPVCQRRRPAPARGVVRWAPGLQASGQGGLQSRKWFRRGAQCMSRSKCSQPASRQATAPPDSYPNPSARDPLHDPNLK